MGQDGYDAIIIGGGIAGLTAARRLAEAGCDTLLFERMQRPGKMSHPCGCMMSPVSGHITMKRVSDGFHFKEADFTFSEDMIIGYPKAMRFMGPDGREFGMHVTKSMDSYPVFQVDKDKLLSRLASTAREAGATLLFGQNVNGLIIEKGAVAGVKVGRDVIPSKAVISAEGLSRKFCREAGLYSGEPSSYIYIEAVYFRGLSLTESQQGQLSMFGSNYSSIPSCSGTFHSLGSDRGIVMLAVTVDKEWPYRQPIGDYLQEFISRCKPVKKLVEDGVAYDKSGCRISVDRPTSLVAGGLIGAGDSVAPLGHSSNAIAILMGAQAGGLAAKAISKGDTSMAALSSYNGWLKSKLFAGVEFEARMVLSMLGMPDEDLIKVSRAFEGFNLEPFFIGNTIDRATATAKLMARPDVIKNWKLVRSLF